MTVKLTAYVVKGKVSVWLAVAFVIDYAQTQSSPINMNDDNDRFPKCRSRFGTFSWTLLSTNPHSCATRTLIIELGLMTRQLKKCLVQKNLNLDSVVNKCSGSQFEKCSLIEVQCIGKQKHHKTSEEFVLLCTGSSCVLCDIDVHIKI